jgi:glutathione S-transferase
VNRVVDVATSFGVSMARLASGMQVGALGARPEQPLEVYEFESCPYCRKVREVLSILDLEALIRPCPKGGSRFRDEVKARGGKALFPYLVDPNTGKELYESDDIIAYLYQHYGIGAPPLFFRVGALGDANSMLASAWRPTGGTRFEPSRMPEQSLELYSFEASPFSRLVREKLCSLELPYLLHNVAKGSPSRPAFTQRSGKMMVPYLVDPNRSVEMFESADIVHYLDEIYAATEV